SRSWPCAGDSLPAASSSPKRSRASWHSSPAPTAVPSTEPRSPLIRRGRRCSRGRSADRLRLSASQRRLHVVADDAAYAAGEKIVQSLYEPVDLGAPDDQGRLEADDVPVVLGERDQHVIVPEQQGPDEAAEAPLQALVQNRYQVLHAERQRLADVRQLQPDHQPLSADFLDDLRVLAL